MMTLILKILGLLVHDHPFQIYYKVRQVLLQNATAYFITKCEQVRVMSCVMFLLKLLGSSALSNNESDGNEVVQTKREDNKSAWASQFWVCFSTTT